MHWRSMEPEDLAAVVAIAESVHPAFPERPEVLDEKRALWPAGALVAEDAASGWPVGYALAHPWRRTTPPPLDTLLGGLPEASDCLYIHDVALLPEARGHGLARAVVTRLATLAVAAGLDRLDLTAVNGSGPRWAALGFTPLRDRELAARLGSYGDAAIYMVRPVSREAFSDGR